MPELKTTAEPKDAAYEAGYRTGLLAGRAAGYEEIEETIAKLTRERDAARDALRDLLNNRGCSCGGWHCARCVIAINDAAAAMVTDTDKPENAGYMNCTCGHYACEHHDVAGCGNAGCDCKQFVLAAETEEQ